MNNGIWVGVVVVLVTACNGGGGETDAAIVGQDTAMDAGGSSGLVGRWLMQVTTGPENQTETLMFNADGSLSAAHSQIDAATAADHAGCTEIVIETGTYVDAGDHASVTLTPGGAMRTYLGCTSSADDGTMAYTGTPIFLAAATLPYTIAGDTLTLTVGGASAVFMRQ